MASALGDFTWHNAVSILHRHVDSGVSNTKKNKIWQHSWLTCQAFMTGLGMSSWPSKCCISVAVLQEKIPLLTSIHSFPASNTVMQVQTGLNVQSSGVIALRGTANSHNSSFTLATVAKPYPKIGHMSLHKACCQFQQKNRGTRLVAVGMLQAQERVKQALRQRPHGCL